MQRVSLLFIGSVKNIIVSTTNENEQLSTLIILSIPFLSACDLLLRLSQSGGSNP